MNDGITRLSAEQFDQLLADLDGPPRVNDRLLAAAQSADLNARIDEAILAQAKEPLPNWLAEAP